MKILAVLRGRPGLGHVTPAVAILDELSMNAEVDLLVCSYDNGAKFLKNSTFKYVDLNIDSPYDCWAGLQIIDHIILKIMPIIKDFEPDLILSAGEYLLPFVKEFLPDCKMGLIYNPEVFVAKKHNEPYRFLFNSLFSKCELLLTHGFIPDAKEVWPEAAELLARSINSQPLVRKAKISKKKNSETLKIVIGNGGGVSLPSDTRTYSNSDNLVKVWKEQNFNYIYGILSHLTSRTEENFECSIFLCLTEEEEHKIKEIFKNESRFVFFSFSPLYIEHLAEADLIITRAGISSVMEIIVYDKSALLWPLIKHEEQIRTVQIIEKSNNRIKGLWDLNEFSTVFDDIKKTIVPAKIKNNKSSTTMKVENNLIDTILNELTLNLK